MVVSNLPAVHPVWRNTTREAMVGVAPRFSFGWRGFYFTYFYFFACSPAGPSPHAGRILTT